MVVIIDTAIKLLTDSLLNCSTVIRTPPAKEFLSHLSAEYVLALIVATLLNLLTIGLFIVQFRYVGTYVTNPYRRAFVLYLAGTAPFISSFALVSMFMPRVWFLAHLLSFFYFSIALYVIICLLLHIVDGRQSMVKKMTQSSASFSVQTPPFCCIFPCLPQLPVETKKVRFCEIMVMQTSIVRLIFTIISLVLYFEYFEESFIVLKVLDFISLPSLLLGIYGCHILVNTVSRLDELCPFRYIVVFRLLDIFFAVFGLQQPLFDFLARAGIFGCGDVLPALETAFFWKNMATVVESLIVSIISSLLLKPSRSALFDKYPSCRSVMSMSTIETNAEC
ncbi:unnamed protein product [Bursaphelenchus okinawaensis]|uniref:Organic solute transporter alpha-like protein n=1 Tax=Bursaphelenchus okinawaensis TaxID=465554 RepID=A0A811K2V4_9BILA|nr:unnamed protein product [Bursaphelenchus okinawaensis]CAG9090755.1 unnamed protein product [Bursaphelenchus okinawaensis]